MKIALFAMTGFGNFVLRDLVEAGFKPVTLVTRAEDGVYPYHPVQNITLQADELGVPVYIGAEGERKVMELKPDLILAATYHRIIGDDVINSARYALNVHPSLLPAHRGPSPVYWAILGGDEETGVTIHKLTSQVDRGDIVWQESLGIAGDDTQGTLRMKLSKLAGRAAVETVRKITQDNLECSLADPAKESQCRRITEEDRLIALDKPAREIERRIRALTPWPGAVINGVKIKRVVSVEISDGNEEKNAGAISLENEMMTAQAADGTLIMEIDKGRAVG